MAATATTSTSTFTSFLMLHVLTALLPPADPENDYYKVLGLSRNATHEEIRQAYRSKSLALHPDKIAQRKSQTNLEQAKQVYERVQKAYNVLIDPQQRKEYAKWKYSPARFEFWNDGMTHPVAVYENLMSASFVDKTRLVILVVLFVLLLWTQPILLAAKVNAISSSNSDGSSSSHSLRSTSWWLILLPTWILFVFDLLIWAMLVVVAKHVWYQMLVSLLEHTCWFIGIILLCRQWENQDNNVQWHRLSIPFYFAILFRIMSAYTFAQYIHQEQKRMTSPHRIEETEGRLDDMDETQRQAIAEKYIIVTPDEEVVVAAMESMRSQGQEITDVILEDIRVQSSPEFEASYQAQRQVVRPMRNLLVYGPLMIALIAAKLQGQIDATWWVIFIPIWIWVGTKMLVGCIISCCVVSDGDDSGDDTNEKPEADVENQNGTENGASTDNTTDNNAESDAKAPTKPSNDVKASLNMFVTPDSGVHTFNSDGKLDESNSGKKAKLPTTSTGIGSAAKSSPTSPVAAAAAADDSESAPDPGIEFDEETFRAWQNAHSKAHQDAQERRGQKTQECFIATFQLIILCLIVGKLEAEYGNSDDDNGYNAFWILFIPFIISGCCLCCCSMLIYGAGASSNLDDLVAKEKREENAESTTAAAAPIVVPSTATTVVQEATVAEKQLGNKNNDNDNEDINDLD